MEREVPLEVGVDAHLELAEHAMQCDIAMTVDAEEADRLELSLQVFEHVFRDAQLSGYDGLGLAVQTYQRRASDVFRYLQGLARDAGRRIPVRLVKGAYWDTEIKHAQELGLESYPVFTRKVHTDVSYLACARLALEAGEARQPLHLELVLRAQLLAQPLGQRADRVLGGRVDDDGHRSPVMFLGYASLAIPFAFALAAPSANALAAAFPDAVAIDQKRHILDDALATECEERAHARLETRLITMYTARGDDGRMALGHRDHLDRTSGHRIDAPAQHLRPLRDLLRTRLHLVESVMTAAMAMKAPTMMGIALLALIANVSSVQNAMGWDDVAMGAITWTLLKLALAGTIAAAALARKGDVIFAGVIGWAAYGIYLKQAATPAVSGAALSLCLLVVMISTLELIRQLRAGGS